MALQLSVRLDLAFAITLNKTTKQDTTSLMSENVAANNLTQGSSICLYRDYISLSLPLSLSLICYRI